MLRNTHVFPPMPEIGLPESYYARLVKKAEASGNVFEHEAAKVGQYVTLGLDPKLDWENKQRYFKHAIRRHCNPPMAVPDEDVWVFFRNLALLVRQYAGQEALCIASAADDRWASRLASGIHKEAVEAEAVEFFSKLMGRGDQQPDWFTDEDWVQLRMIRDHWI